MNIGHDGAGAMVAVGVAEVDSPPYPWRPLRAVLSGRDESRHRWTAGSEDDPYSGSDLPADVFERRVEEGLATRLDEPVELRRDHVLVRLADGSFTAKHVDDVRGDRSDFLVSRIEDALSLNDSGRVLEAVEALEQARLAEDWHPMASIILGGLALQNRRENWAEPLLIELGESVHLLELETIRQSIVWEDLPQPARRAKWLDEVQLFASECRQPPPWVDLIPLDPAFQQDAIVLLTAREELREELDVLGRLPHGDLKRLVRAEPAVVQALSERLRVALDVEDHRAVIETLRRRLDGRGEHASKVKKVIETRVKQADWVRQAEALWRVEATTGVASRFRAWSSAIGWLGQARARPGLEPWREGEACAKVLLHNVGQEGQGPPRRLAEWARKTMGLAAPATTIEDEDIDACHVVSHRAPPACFLDSERIMRRGLTTRLAIAKAIGYQALGAAQAGAHLSHAPSQDAPGSQKPTTELERAVNGFAVYFVAPREAVKRETRLEENPNQHDYAREVQKVMRNHGMNFSAAFSHLANCHGFDPPFDIYKQVSERVDHDAVEAEWSGERLPVPPADSYEGVPIERRDGFASLLSRAVRQRSLTEEKAIKLLGGPRDQAREILRRST